MSVLAATRPLAGEVKPASSWPDMFAVLALVAAVALWFLGAPGGNRFWWSDSPSHALNGVFLVDFLRSGEWTDPMGFATRYFVQYPAITIGLYPPLFYVVSAPFYAVLGPTQEAGLAAVFVHYAVCALGAYRLARFWWGVPLSLATALTLVVAPEMGNWGRQVMLEVPSMAFAVWSLVFFIAYTREQKPWRLYLSLFLLVCAIWTKLSSAFIVFPYFGMLLWLRGTRLFTDRHTWIQGALFAIGVAPMLAMTLWFGQANLQSVAGLSDATVDRGSLENWLWYGRLMHRIVGWPVLVLGALGGVFALLGLVRVSRSEARFWLGWFAAGYVFFSAIDLKEVRHALLLALPLVLLAMLAVDRLAAWALAARPRLAPAAGFGLFAATLLISVLAYPPRSVGGYAEAARQVATLAPRDSVVLYSGNLHQSFVFAMRGQDRPDLTTLRANKLLFTFAVRMSLGVEQRNYTRADIPDLLDRNGVHYLVVQPRFAESLEVMREFYAALETDRFERVAVIPTPATWDRAEWDTPVHELWIYRNKGNVAQGPIRLELDLPVINRRVTGEAGG